MTIIQNLKTALSKFQWRRHKTNPAYLMWALCFFLLLYPFFDTHRFSKIILGGCFSLIMISALLNAWRSRVWFFVTLLVGLPWMIMVWSELIYDHGQWSELVLESLMLVFLILVILQLLLKLWDENDVTAGTIYSAISAYLLIGIFFAGLYSMVGIIDLHAFELKDPDENITQWGVGLYFSFTTLTTLGFGDITPISPFARALCNFESFTGPIYLSVLIARLVGMYSSKQMLQRTRGDDSDPVA